MTFSLRHLVVISCSFAKFGGPLEPIKPNLIR